MIGGTSQQRILKAGDELQRVIPEVTIAGEINLDLILYGLPENMPVERELLASDFQVTLGSSSAILAHNLSVLGARVGFITRAGRDDFGRLALERLQESGADVSHSVWDAARPTGVTVVLDHGRERRILTYLGTISELSAQDLDLEYLQSARHFHLSSLFLQRGLARDLPTLFRKLKESGVTISLDTNDDPEDRWEGVLDELLSLADILLPNERELCRIARRDTLDESLAALSGRVPCIAVKCGSRGAVVEAGSRRSAAAPIQVSAVDSVGAGDSFNAGFLYAWLQGLEPEACARAGNIAGALSTLRRGGTEAFRDRALVDSFLKEHGFPAARPRGRQGRSEETDADG
jgi:sugar/nucleoside kinase (ribokinase family)